MTDWQLPVPTPEDVKRAERLGAKLKREYEQRTARLIEEGVPDSAADHFHQLMSKYNKPASAEA